MLGSSYGSSMILPRKRLGGAVQHSFTLFFFPSTSNTEMFPFLQISSPGGCFHTHFALMQHRQQGLLYRLEKSIDFQCHTIGPFWFSRAQTDSPAIKSYPHRTQIKKRRGQYHQCKRLLISRMSKILKLFLPNQCSAQSTRDSILIMHDFKLV